MGKRGRLLSQRAVPARLGSRGSCAPDARPDPTGAASGPSSPPRLWRAGGPSRGLSGACFTRAARRGNPAHQMGRNCGRRLLRTLSLAPLCYSRSARIHHAVFTRRPRRTLGFCDALHSLRRRSRDRREPDLRAPDHAGDAALAGACGGEPILRGPSLTSPRSRESHPPTRVEASQVASRFARVMRETRVDP
jgi:hypothetical protein